MVKVEFETTAAGVKVLYDAIRGLIKEKSEIYQSEKVGLLEEEKKIQKKCIPLSLTEREIEKEIKIHCGLRQEVCQALFGEINQLENLLYQLK